jgi:hypothetical protein
VLIVQTPDEKVGYLAAFSGNLAGSNLHQFFVPPVYDLLQPDGFFRIEEANISAINKQIKELEGVNPIRDLLNNDTFFEIEENLVALNAHFLKNHPNTEILTVDEMFAVLEEFVGREIKRS